MEVGVRIEAEAWTDAEGAPKHVASAYFVFVAIDEDGRSRRVPRPVPDPPDEVRRWREAEIRRSPPLAGKPEIEAGRNRFSAVPLAALKAGPRGAPPLPNPGAFHPP